ncbi:adenosylcobinamide kinase /adenosylcobinamide-phosphate guanylyltransferase [Jatrophihabitans endophyticus]|uniref:uroporphyrinogen-III C-methyltransferase n=1 Tax=Jatrophihabitans endophyticus TaxID=1206085 RepID=A0A1M5Q7S3_9ACTN|nr:uroporphyrinogen-III C-methyltransferase [Jatrophihabitans endophyticus]SHH09956.1 adenosylcobinamide kinase /adenosylcobinamide-phosphate guanylyltransferase [Jatrophihabitans endophyticus]
MTGRVVLVGGGPGADDLITVRGLDRLLAADVVVVDRLAPTGLLDRLGPDVEVVDAARTPTRRTLTHDEIVALLVDRARAGKLVVRLKGGDPFVLAHGAQEVAACAAAGVEVEVVPGVSSATGAPVLAGVPLTAVDGATGFTVVSGHADPEDPANPLDWSALARGGTTLVVLMGMKQLPAITARLLAEGVPADAVASCVADASLPTQRSVRGTLRDFAQTVADAGLRNPAVVVIETGARHPARRTLVLGGSRSGKSGYAESLLAGRPDVTYVATAADRPGDAEWDERIARHRQRRPAAWTTLETGDLVAALRGARGALLVDSVTTWLARAMDDCGYWTDDDRSAPTAEQALADRVDALVAAWRDCPGTVVAVSDEVGSGVVPATHAGRAFRDALGELNQRLAAAADEVQLVTAGIARRLR